MFLSFWSIKKKPRTRCDKHKTWKVPWELKVHSQYSYIPKKKKKRIECCSPFVSSWLCYEEWNLWQQESILSTPSLGFDKVFCHPNLLEILIPKLAIQILLHVQITLDHSYNFVQGITKARNKIHCTWYREFNRIKFLLKIARVWR